jgi:hypothetical protein
VRVDFRVNGQHVQILARPMDNINWEPYALDLELGEFYLSETDDIEMREDGGPWISTSLLWLYQWFNDQPIKP